MSIGAIRVWLLKRKLFSEDVTVSGNAAWNLAKSEDPGALNLLLDVLKEEVRPGFVRALGCFKAAEVEKELLRYLGHHNGQVRSAAVLAFGDLRDGDAIGAIRKALDDDDESVSTVAADTILRLTSGRDQRAEWLDARRAAKECRESVRRSRAEQTLVWDGKSFVPLLLPAKKLAELVDFRVDPLIAWIRMRKSGCGTVRAIEALGEIRNGSEKVLAVLGQALVRRGELCSAKEEQIAAAKALQKIGKLESVEVLREALTVDTSCYPASRLEAWEVTELHGAVAEALRAIDPMHADGYISSAAGALERKAAEARSKLEAAKARAGADVRGKSEAEMLCSLRRLCAAWAEGGTGDDLIAEARAIGEELHSIGGMTAMRRVFAALEQSRGVRTLEMTWNGIGDWRG